MSVNQVRRFGSGDRRKILIVDDEAVNREVLAAAIGSSYDLLFAADGLEAMEILGTYGEEISAVLLDIIMPKIDGLQVLEMMKTDPRLHLIPVVVLTSDQSVEVECLERGASDFITKPYPRPEIIRARVQKTIASARAFLSYARSIAEYFEILFYVDRRTGVYSSYSDRELSADSALLRGVGRFFEDIRNHFLPVIYEADTARMSKILEQENLIRVLEEEERLNVDFRLLFDGVPVYYRIEAFYPEVGDTQHFMIGLRNIADELSEEQRREDAEAASVTYSRIAQALAQDYYAVYYVNSRTNHYLQYRMDGADHQLRLELTGEDFFNQAAADIRRRVHPADVETVLGYYEKENLLGQIEGGQTATYSYRLLEGDESVHVSIKVQPLLDDPDHMVIGLSNIEAQYRREAQNVTYSRIATALASDFFSIYYVDMETEEFLEYSASEEYDSLGVEKRGDHFFATSHKNILRIIHPEDRGKLLLDFTRENVQREVDTHNVFTLQYRILFDGEPTWVALKATKIQDEDGSGHHIVIGVSNVDAQKKREAQVLTYSQIADSLAADYFSIYYVDMDTEEFMEYSASEEYRELGVETMGQDFFSLSRKNIASIIYPEDKEMLLSAFTKENIQEELSRSATFTMRYRLLFGGEPTWVQMKASRMNKEGDSHIVIGVASIQAQMQREHDLNVAREKANVDALTGVKSKHAYVEAESNLNTFIGEGTAPGFAVAVCDVNGLKTINDTLGHAAGDQLIRDASKSICDIFKRSPVYRIGGDEFVVLMRGGDYEDRDELLQSLQDENLRNRENGGVVIAAGMGVFEPGKDAKVSDVFERADQAMYDNKVSLKGGREFVR